MNRRNFVKLLSGTALAPISTNSNFISATSLESFSHPNHFDFFDSLPIVNRDLGEMYFPPNYDEQKTYDVIVIGSGIGGGVLADATSDAGLKTLVLEAGPLRHFVHVANLPIGNALEIFTPYELVPGSSTYGGISFCLGGKSIYWSNVIPRMEPWELKYWPEVTADYLLREGYSNAETTFRKQTKFQSSQLQLRDTLETELSDFSVANLPRAYHTPDGSSGKSFRGERTTGAFSTAALLTSSIVTPGRAGSDNLTINLNQLVTHIETDKRRAVSVHCYDPVQRKTRRFKGRSIVICAGTMESARISLCSGLKDLSGKLARGATYHQSAESQFTIPDTYDVLTRYEEAKILLRPKNHEQQDQFTCELALNWQFWDAKTEDDDIWNQRFSFPGASRSTMKFLFRHPLNDKNFLKVSNGKCNAFIEPMSGEPFKQQITRLQNRIFNFLGVEKEQSTQDIAYHQAGDGMWHIAGSLRMGDRGVGVVDTNLKFHEYDNLYACDLSVFPDIPAANPSLTLGALAIRLAKELSK